MSVEKLFAATTSAEVSPDHGGSIIGFEVGGRAILRRGIAGTHPLLYSSFPLVPYCNRIRSGSFRFEDQAVELRPNFDQDPHPLHGDGWLERWDVVAVQDDVIELSLTRPAGEWPWRYRAHQRISVEAGRLSVTLTVENLSERAMPVGLGFHPYFERPARLTATVDGWWTGDGGLPDRWEERDSLRATDIDRLQVDNTFTGWDGKAIIETPTDRIMLASDLPMLHLYSPKGGNFFCAEPVSSAPDAPNHPERGLSVLQPGTSRSSTMTIATGP